MKVIQNNNTTAEDNQKKMMDISVIERRLPPKLPRSHHSVIKLRGVSKHFKVGESLVRAIQDIDLTLYSGEFVIVYGPSGCGKSTFLHMVLGIEEPTIGTIEMRNEDIYNMESDVRTKFRREKIGMVFQQSNWIKSLNVWENVAYPLWLSSYDDHSAYERALKYLNDVGMKEYAHHKPSELSGGQQQRVALARALITDPWIIIADEPTGNLDTDSSAEIMRLLTWLNREKRRMVIMVTHEMAFLDLATRRVGMKDGHILFDEHDEIVRPKKVLKKASKKKTIGEKSKMTGKKEAKKTT